jgi:GAF domain protein
MSFQLKALANLDDKKRMDELINFIKIQLDDESDQLALMSNISAFIMASIRDLNWAGFYFYKEDELILGAFQGLPACTRLSLDKGVCAKAFCNKKPIKVDNVHEFADHIACDSQSESELVLPLFHEGRVYGVMDLDSNIENRFTDIELEGFTKISKLIEDKIYVKF